MCIVSIWEEGQWLWQGHCDLLIQRLFLVRPVSLLCPQGSCLPVSQPSLQQGHGPIPLFWPVGTTEKSTEDFWESFSDWKGYTKGSFFPVFWCGCVRSWWLEPQQPFVNMGEGSHLRTQANMLNMVKWRNAKQTNKQTTPPPKKKPRLLMASLLNWLALHLRLLAVQENLHSRCLWHF